MSFQNLLLPILAGGVRVRNRRNFLQIFGLGLTVKQRGLHAVIALVIGLSLAGLSLGPAAGQTRGDDDDYSGFAGQPNEEDFIRTGSGRIPPRVTDERTDSVVNAINAAARFCRQIPEEVYILDCYAAELRQAAKKISANGDYADARAALEAASDKLDALVSQNRDTTKPAKSVRTSGPKPRRGVRKYNAVKASSLPAIKAQSAAIIREAQTVLLRSTGNSDRRRSHYQRIAKSLETGTVMLRSL